MRRLSPLLLALFVLLAGPAAARAVTCPTPHWVAAWAGVPTDASGGFEGQTVRQILTPHLGGDQLRLRLSNRFGAQAVTIDATTLGRSAGGAAVTPGTAVPVTFGGERAVSIPIGGEAVSDPITLTAAPFERLALSTYFAAGTGPATQHYYGRQLAYATDPRGQANLTDQDSAEGFDTLAGSASYFAVGFDVQAASSVGTVVAFGDSLTDGFEAGPNAGILSTVPIGADASYPDELARRLLTTSGAPPLTVAAAGISGNRILQDGLIPVQGISMLQRLAPDALAQPGATTVIVQGGANDLGSGGADAAAVITGLDDLVARVRAAGLRPLLGTLTPSQGARPAAYGDPAYEAARGQVNAWIRSGAAGNDVGLVDFDAALADPTAPGRLNPAYDSGDGLHPNAAGYRAMAGAVDLSLLRAPACECPVRGPLTVTVPAKYRPTLRSAVVRVDGRRVGTIRRRTGRVKVDFRRVTSPVATVQTTIRLSGGRTVTRTQRVARCAA